MATKKKKIDSSKIKSGAFTAWCKRMGYSGVTSECIQKGLKSKNAHVRKMANFARNSRKWKH